MRWINSIPITLFFLITGCVSQDTSNKGYLISANRLLEIIDEKNTLVVDLRKPERFATSHLPGAVNIWRSEIQDDSYPYQGIVAPKSQIEKVLGNKGVSHQHFLVLYDDDGSTEATRMWWVLKYYGFKNMAILDGGVKAWEEVSKLSTDEIVRPPNRFELPGNGDREMIISMNEINELMSNPTVAFLDTRTTNEYKGIQKKKGAKFAGRLIGSQHIDWISAVNDNHKFRSIDELEELYAPYANDLVVTYCHSGVRSAHTYFVLTELLGWKNVRNYDGSWVEWSHHEQPYELDTMTNQL